MVSEVGGKKINVTQENREFQREGSQQCKF